VRVEIFFKRTAWTEGEVMPDFEQHRQTHSDLRNQPARPDGQAVIRPSPPTPNFHSDVGAGPATTRENLSEALARFDESDPVIPLLMKNANILVENREHRLAINILRSVLLRQPMHLEAIEQMGICQRELARPEEALKCFRELARFRRDARAMSLVAETLYLMEKDQQALDTYLEVLRQVGSDDQRLFEIYKNIGNIYVRAGDYDLAEEFYNKAYTLFSDSDVLMVNYGTLEIQRGAFEEALLRFRRAVEINPSNDRGWVGLAILHRQMGDAELASANVARALDICFDNRTALRLAVDWAAQDHVLSSVIPRLEQYLASHGEDAEIAFMLGKVFANEGRFMESRLELERVLALDPEIEGAESLRRALDKEIGRIGLQA
jgi:tetratricopeptide (TPR) repeat protein